MMEREYDEQNINKYGHRNKIAIKIKNGKTTNEKSILFFVYYFVKSICLCLRKCNIC